MIEEAECKVVYAKNVGMKEFEIPFRFIRGEHIKVFHDGSEEYVYGQDYTVNGVTENGGKSYTHGTVEFTEAPDCVIAIVRRVPLEQTTDYLVNGDLPAETLEGDLDYLTMEVQQISEVLGRCLKVDETSESDPAQVLKSILSIKDPEAISKAEKWAEEAQTGASSAAGSATSAAGSATAAGNSATAAAGHATAAQGHAANAETSEGNAYNYAATAAEASNSAVTAASEIREIAEEATLNRVTLAFGDWGGDGMYITYNDWTPVETLTKFSNQISEHNTDATAHNDIRGALTRHNTSALAHSTLFEENESAHEAIMGNFSSTKISTLAHNQYTYRFTRPVNNSIQTIYISQMTEDQVYRARVEVMLQCVANDPDTGYLPGDYAVLAEALPVPLLFTDRILYATGEKLTVIHKNRYEKVDITLYKWNYIFRIWY